MSQLDRVVASKGIIICIAVKSSPEACNIVTMSLQVIIASLCFGTSKFFEVAMELRSDEYDAI